MSSGWIRGGPNELWLDTGGHNKLWLDTGVTMGSGWTLGSQ